MSFPPAPSGTPWPSTHLDKVLERLDARKIDAAEVASSAKTSALEKRMTETARHRLTPFTACRGKSGVIRLLPSAVSGVLDFSSDEADDEVARHPPTDGAATSMATSPDLAVPHEREDVPTAAHPSPPGSELKSLSSSTSKVSGKTYSHHIRALINHMYMFDMCKNCIAEDMLLIAESLYINDSRK